MNYTKALRFCAVVLAFVALASVAQAEGVVSLINTRTETYKNVTLVSHNATHVFVQHARGMATLKLDDLDKDALIDLGVIADDRVKEGDSSTADQEAEGGLAESEGEQAGGDAAYVNKLSPEAQERLKSVSTMVKSFTIVLWVGVMLFCLCLFLFYCFCVKLICEKSGVKTSWLVWIPFYPIQKLLLFRAARMPSFSLWIAPLWFAIAVAINAYFRHGGKVVPPWFPLLAVLVFLALLLIVHLVWCVRICSARGKGILAMLCMIFPLTSPLAFLYLAFSGGSGEVEDDYRPIRLDPLPA
jgi:hypothetical protein